MRTSNPLPVAAALAVVLLVGAVWWRGHADRDSGPDHTAAARAQLPFVTDDTEASSAHLGRLSTGSDSNLRTDPVSDLHAERASAPDAGPDLAFADPRDPSRPPSPGDPSEPSFGFVRSALADALESHLPTLTLSATELDALADATLRLRSAQQSLRTIPEDRDHATQRADVRRRLEGAITDFSYVLEMSPAEFTRRVQPESGIDDWPLAEMGDTAAEVSIRPILPADARE